MLSILLSLSGTTESSSGASPVERLLEPARQGDKQAREELLQAYQPLVLRIGAQLSGRFLQVGRDEEVSIGLLALNEAIDRYDPTRGAPFIPFAEVVIKRRLIDHYRRQKSGHEIPLSELAGDDEIGGPVQAYEVQEATERFTREQEAADRREEIARYAKRLLEFGIRFTELVEVCPKHRDARDRALEAARLVANTASFADHLRSKKELPLKHLEQHVGVSRKTLERQRKYIIAVALIFLEEFHFLKGYVGAS